MLIYLLMLMTLSILDVYCLLVQPRLTIYCWSQGLLLRLADAPAPFAAICSALLSQRTIMGASAPTVRILVGFQGVGCST